MHRQVTRRPPESHVHVPVTSVVRLRRAVMLTWVHSWMCSPGEAELPAVSRLVLMQDF